MTTELTQLLREAAAVIVADYHTVDALPEPFRQNSEAYLQDLNGRLESAAGSLEAQEPDKTELYNDFQKWCRDNPGFDLDSRLHTHGGPIDQGGYISHDKTRAVFAAYRAGRLYRHPPTSAVPELVRVLRECVVSVLGWRELRSGNEFPVERVEELCRDALQATAQETATMSDYEGIHTCSYHCHRPDCIKAQRDELRDRLAAAEERVAQLEGDLAQAAASLEAQEPVACIVEAALYDFGGYITTRETRLVASAYDEASPVADAIDEFCTLRGIQTSGELPIAEWQDMLSTPQQGGGEDE